MGWRALNTGRFEDMGHGIFTGSKLSAAIAWQKRQSLFATSG